MVRYGHDTIFEGTPAEWFGAAACADVIIIDVLQPLNITKIVAASASSPAKFVLYLKDDTLQKWVKKAETVLTPPPASAWTWQEYGIDPQTVVNPIPAGRCAVLVVFETSPTDTKNFGIAARPITAGEENQVFRYWADEAPFNYNTLSTILSELPYTPNQSIDNVRVSLYLTDEGYVPPISPPTKPAQAMVIPSLLSTKTHAMRGYGGFIDGMWTTKQYKFVRMQVYGDIVADGDLVPQSNYGVGNEGGASWATVEQFLRDVAAWGGIPNLSCWVNNWEDLSEEYRTLGTNQRQVRFFERLKLLMAIYGITEMIFEPCWEWNGAGAVSGSQTRDAHIEPSNYLYGMAALRKARDSVGINCSIVSHILALHGDTWYDPTRETWKRTYMKDWFDGMAFADIITVSLYLTDTDAKWTGAWNTYLQWVYTNVIGLQKQETGWSPAVYVGFSEHNLNGGELTQTAPFQTDFDLFQVYTLKLMGFWMPMTDPTVLSFVNDLAQTMQGEVPPPVLTTIEINLSPNGVTSPAGLQTGEVGSTLTVAAIANAGFKFTHWEKDGVDYSSNNPETFTFELSNYRIEPIFEVTTEPPPVYYTCTICGAMFLTQALLDAHMAAVHPSQPPSEACALRAATGGTMFAPLILPPCRAFRDRYLPHRLTHDYYVVSRFLEPVIKKLRRVIGSG